MIDKRCYWIRNFSTLMNHLVYAGSWIFRQLSSLLDELKPLKCFYICAMNNLQDVLEIGRIDLAELKALQELSKKTFYEAFAWSTSPEDMQAYLDTAFSEERLGSELQGPDSQFYFARLHGRPVGYLKLNFGKAQTEDLEGYGMEIERIYILQEFQGRKIGQQLIARAIGIAEELKMEHVWLGVWEKNSGAIALYQRQGFVQVGSHPFMMGKDHQTDLILKRILKG